MKYYRLLIYFALPVFLLFSCKEQPGSSEKVLTDGIEDPLPSWNDGDSKKAVISYVESIIDTASSSFIPVSERIAAFDNDGTLWSEQPAYFQLFFALDRIKEMAPEHPEWKNEEPFKSVLENDMESFAKQGMEGLLKIVMVSHAGMESEDFKSLVAEWISTAQHPTKKVKYTNLVYQPMIELMNYLRENDFKVYIVSGGGIDFMRVFASDVYDVPSEQVIGSRLKTEFIIKEGKPGIYRLPELDFIDDKEGKPLNIQKIIGKKPVFVGGNSDGDLAMMQWAHSNSYKNFNLYVHHTDSIREWAYDRQSHIGRLDKGLEEAAQKGWTVVDMSKDWKVVYPFEMTSQVQ